MIAFAGDNRIRFRYWISDPRARHIKIHWSSGRDSLIVPVVPQYPAGAYELTLEAPHKTIAENNYTFQWVTWDNLGNRSTVFEKNASVYGSRYRARLTSKIVSNLEFPGNDLTLHWAAPTNANDIGVELTYTGRDGLSRVEYVSNSDMSYTVEVSGVERTRYKNTLPDVDLTKGVSYQTLYLPEPTAIDTFRTESARVAIVQRVNVALGKAATASSITSGFPATNAVDGLRTDASRWVSATPENQECWLEIDLGDEYTIDGIKTWNGSSGVANTAIPKFDFEAWDGSGWQKLISETSNAAAEYSKNFTPVTTSKVRFYSYIRTRLFEIEVYSTIAY